PVASVPSEHSRVNEPLSLDGQGAFGLPVRVLLPDFRLSLPKRPAPAGAAPAPHRSPRLRAVPAPAARPRSRQSRAAIPPEGWPRAAAMAAGRGLGATAKVWGVSHEAVRGVVKRLQEGGAAAG